MGEVMTRGIINMPLEMVMGSINGIENYHSTSQSLLADYDALRAENAELKRDAERYRFARALENDCWMLNTLQRVSGAELDSAIDAALAKHRCATQPTDKP